MDEYRVIKQNFGKTEIIPVLEGYLEEDQRLVIQKKVWVWVDVSEMVGGA